MDYYNRESVIDQEGLDFILESPEGLEEAEEAVANREGFPLLIVIAAIIKDSVDVVTLGFLGFMTGPILSMIIFFYMFGKSSFIKKRMWKWFLKRFIWTSAIEILPGFSILPITTTLVISTHYRETKIIKELDYIIQEVYEGRQITLDRMSEIAYA